MNPCTTNCRKSISWKNEDCVLKINKITGLLFIAHLGSSASGRGTGKAPKNSPPSVSDLKSSQYQFFISIILFFEIT